MIIEPAPVRSCPYRGQQPVFRRQGLFAVLRIGGCAAGRSVRDGPFATKPTPRVISTMPDQRSSEMVREARSGRKGRRSRCQRGGGEDEGEVGPGERGEVAGEEADQQSNAESDPGSEDSGDERDGMCEGDGGKGVMPRERHVSPSGRRWRPARGSCIAAAIRCGEPSVFR